VWLGERRSLGALQLVAFALIHTGSRSDLGALVIYDEMPREAAEAIVANTNFAVCRRSID